MHDEIGNWRMVSRWGRYDGGDDDDVDGVVGGVLMIVGLYGVGRGCVKLEMHGE